MYEGRRGRKHARRGKRGACTYCGVFHTRGRKSNSCRGHGHSQKISNSK